MSQLHKEANYSKICRLLIGKGGIAFRGVLQSTINKSPPPSTLVSFLNSHKASLHNLTKRRVINPTQWDLLFPASGSSDSKSFDITLLTILLRNVCGLSSPAAGWNARPPATDTTVSAEILRIKMFRNEVYAHVPGPKIDDTEFEKLWQEISKPLIKLGIPQQEIDDLKEAPLSSEEENYIQELKEWKEFEDDVISKMNDLGEQVGIVKKKITNVENDVVFVKEKVINMLDNVAHVENEVVKLQKKNVKSSEIEKLAKFVFKGKIEMLHRKFQEGTREWFFDQFEEWLDNKNSRVLILIAGPGAGKSVLSARICELYEESGQLAACHFCDFKTSDSRDPYKILKSLASQMCDNVDGFRDKLTEVLSREHSQKSLPDAFRVLLNDPLHALDRNEPMLIVVDALDESETANKSKILELISEEFRQLPVWIKIFITSRPELQVKKKLVNLNPVEILPNNKNQKDDLAQFIQRCLPLLNISKPYTLDRLLDKCKGSFLYAYYLVNEIERLGTELDVDRYIPQGISGFYEKQFERLKRELQGYEKDLKVSTIFESFVNVVAASKAPLPFTALLTCMDLSDKKFEIREMIVGIMSEILPVYNDCLTVFHKSLWDWLTLHGHKEHAFAADVADGKKRLWRFCKQMFMGIDYLNAVSNFQISPEESFALENCVNYFVNVDGAEDWEWLLDVQVNYFKFCYFLKSVKHHLRFTLLEIIEEYKSRISDDFFSRLFQLYTFLRTCKNARLPNTYLQHFANKKFSLVQNSTSSRTYARKKLDQTKEIWVEEVTTETNSSFKIISNAFLENDIRPRALSASPDNKLLAMRSKHQVKVYESPSLKSIFKLDIAHLDDLRVYCGDLFLENTPFIVFSPDSSYFLLNSIQIRISIKSQSAVPFIPLGPAKILWSSFSSCGTKLVSAEKQSIKVWDVEKKELLTESSHDFGEFDLITSFSGCMSYIFLFDCYEHQLNVYDSTTLNKLATTKTDTWSTKFDDCIEFICPRFSKEGSLVYSLDIKCWQLTTGKNILCTREYCSMPFVWKGRKCVLTSSEAMALVVYDYFNLQIIDTFQISSLPSFKVINYIANLGENNFLICLDHDFVFVLSLESSSEFSALSYINVDTCPMFWALSPDNLYVACSYGSPILRIMNVDNGKTLQTVTPKQKPIAGWWSELYLWVVCEGSVVVKYPYTSTHRNVVGNYVEECSIDCDGDVLKFEEGVLVCYHKNEKNISISKICHKNLCPQQILDTKIESFGKVAISSDGCAVLLYHISDASRLYELWEMRSENKWELHSTGKLDGSTRCACLAGRQNSRSLLSLKYPSSYSYKTSDDDSHETSDDDSPETSDDDSHETSDDDSHETSDDDSHETSDDDSHYFRNTSALCSIDFLDATQKSIPHQLPVKLIVPKVIYVDSKFLICHDSKDIHFIHVPDGTVITSLHVGYIEESSFFVPSKRLLFLSIGNGIIKHFKIHNIDKYLPLY